MSTKTAQKTINYASYKGIGRPTKVDYQDRLEVLKLIFNASVLVLVSEYLISLVG
jgi:hypothetical protein